MFSLCAKRKTGSKQLISWLNRFGHGISYDEVNFLETHLVDDELQIQWMLREPAPDDPSCLIISRL